MIKVKMMKLKSLLEIYVTNCNLLGKSLLSKFSCTCNNDFCLTQFQLYLKVLNKLMNGFRTAKNSDGDLTFDLIKFVMWI